MCFAQGTVQELPMKAGNATSKVALGAHSVVADPVCKSFPVQAVCSGGKVFKMWFKLELSCLVITSIVADRNSSAGDQVGCGFVWPDLECLQG